MSACEHNTVSKNTNGSKYFDCSRTVLLCMLVQACDGVWVLEQPGSSTLEFYPAWLTLMTAYFNHFGCAATFLVYKALIKIKHKQPLCLVCKPDCKALQVNITIFPLAQVSKVCWWMSRYGGSSPKRQWAYSNSPAIKRLDVGWKRMSRRKLQTTIRYKNRDGKWCYKGARGLRSTETISLIK